MLDLSPDEHALLSLHQAVAASGYAFTTPTPATHARVNFRAQTQGAEEARTIRDVFGWSRPFQESVLPPAVFGLAMQAGVLEPSAQGWRSTVRFSTLGHRLYVHSAYPTSAADAVFFGPDTYRFANAIAALPPRSTNRPAGRAVDIGCGAGPGAIAAIDHLEPAEVYAADINDRALAYTRVNAAAARVAVTAIHSNLLGGLSGEFDLIVANPPYLVDAAERAYRHGGGPLGAGLSLAILEAACTRLAPGGTLLLYTGAAILGGADLFREAVQNRLAGAELTWSYREVDPDVFGEEVAEGAYTEADRIAAVVLTVQKKEKHDA